MKPTIAGPEHQTPRHPIAVVSERTGLSQDLLRVWERRYRAVEPTRSGDGRRLYSDADIGRLRLLHAATSAGRSISQVAGLSTEELSRIAAEDAAERHAPKGPASRAEPAPRLPSEDVVHRGLSMASALQATELEHLLRRSAAQFGLTPFIEDIATPILRRIGELWHAGRASIAQEHLASSIIHDILSEAMRSMGRATGAPVVLVATPSGERHTIGATLIGAAAAAAGWHVVYLGADLPAKEIAAAAVATKARVVALSIIYVHDREQTFDELRALRARLPQSVPILAGGSGSSAIAVELERTGIRVGAGLADLSAVLEDAIEKDAA